MKRKERYKILNYAKKQYSEAFDLNLQFKHLPRKDLLALLQRYHHSSMCEWSYCCNGLYQNCWQELIAADNWDATQESVDKYIKQVIIETSKACKKDSRILYCDLGYRIDVIIVMRDLDKKDYLITYENI